MSELTKRAFTDNQRKILRLAERGKTARYISKKLTTKYNDVCSFLKSAEAFAYLRGEALTNLGGQGAAVAIKTLIEVASNKKAASQARVSAADKLLHYTGLKIDIDPRDKSPSTMTADELYKRLQLLQKEAANRAKPINIIEGEKVEIEDTDFADLMK